MTIRALNDSISIQDQLNMKGANNGALTGKNYIESLKDSREVWLSGQKVDVTTHEAFSGMMNELARLYDVQHSEEFKNQMTYLANNGNQVSLSYLLPKTQKQLEQKWRNTHLWMEQSWGQLPRIPDFMSNVVVGLYDYREELGNINPLYKENVMSYYRYCQQNDINITHAIGDPQIDRSSSPVEDPDLALRVVRKTKEGVIIRGAKQLATLAPLAHEVLIYMSPTFAMREIPEFVLWCALPMGTPGIKVLCREPHSLNVSGHSHPMASKYDEQDAMLFFDDVLVPWNRVFLLEDSQVAVEGFPRLNAWALYVGQIRFYHRIKTLRSVAKLMAESIGVHNYPNIQDLLGELTSYLEIVRIGIKGLHHESKPTAGGLLAPGNTLALDAFAGQISDRITEIVREIGASGIVMQPSESDLENPELKPFLEKYMRGKNLSVYQKSRLFRIAWDLVGDSFGMRQELYEKWNRGSMVRNRILLYKNYNDSSIEEKIKELINNPIKS
ncbi:MULTISPECIES: 4-hydroxyphenylacetate 3-hydroxylase family protein [Bacillus cereus group]|uniref:4-hydroxyphenylacetate 3-hydroxylase n=1 Tax=Bacillus cereus TaxID=1396 RepID=A0A9W7QGA4_BACCE|nr:4-hydroxyphenylacetate 3-hydroxylase N-terminal domain-containing protein [Bacillus cereus]KAB2395348.1 4-hydroxyphenylacetate 3-hydroxylase [Bacillus cereus]KAB2408102.1 4-hydroxyphenylacetate 3-hydroxylase [Bacillus cereus]KAB2430939.1 4-hydroxyphenylacetate 3-hydroxylase [Bacillus cereus]